MNKWQQATTVRLSIFGYVFSEKVRNSRPEDPGVVIGPEGVRYVLGEAAICWIDALLDAQTSQMLGRLVNSAIGGGNTTCVTVV